MSLLLIVLSTVIISALSLVGMLFLFFREKHLPKIVLSLVALSAGAMLGNALFHLLPESFELAHEGGVISVFQAMLLFTLAFALSFLFEQLFAWHHCHRGAHHAEHSDVEKCMISKKPYTQLVLISDGIHNFIDGIIIAASFIVSPSLGIATTVAIALHEVPQELGDYAVLVHGGYKKGRALLLNAISASSVILGGVVGYFVSTSFEIAVPILLPFAAGAFVYIAASDLLPELKHEEKIKDSLIHFGIFALGILIMIGSVYLEVGHAH